MQTPIRSSKQLIPLAEAAHQLGVAYLTARDMLLRGDLKGLKQKKRWYVERGSLDEAITNAREVDDEPTKAPTNGATQR